MRKKSELLMKQILDYVNSSYEATGRIPTYREIGAVLNIGFGTVSKYVKEMSEKGMLQSSNGSRSITTGKMQKSERENVQVGIIGTIACGAPMFAEENMECYVPFPKALLGNGTFYALHATGDSMIDAGINDGDLVVIRQQETAEEGQIIVALIDNETTLKRFYIDKAQHKVRLHPENVEYSDMYFDDIQIQGVAVKVVKDLF